MVSTRQMAITTGPGSNDDGFQPMAHHSNRSPHHSQAGTSHSGQTNLTQAHSTPTPMVICSSISVVPACPNVVLPGQHILLENLPIEIMYKIFSYIEFKKVAQVRMVSSIKIFQK